MPHSFGYRARTRHLFSKNFRQHGFEHLSTYMKVYRVGDIVDIKANAAIHKGMPHKFYHGYISFCFDRMQFIDYFELSLVVIQDPVNSLDGFGMDSGLI
jgi:ribosomal protein L21E